MLSSREDSVEEGESLPFMFSGSHLICHSTTPLIWHISALEGAFCRQCMKECSTTKDVKRVLKCRA